MPVSSRIRLFWLAAACSCTSSHAKREGRMLDRTRQVETDSTTARYSEYVIAGPAHARFRFPIPPGLVPIGDFRRFSDARGARVEAERSGHLGIADDGAAANIVTVTGDPHVVGRSPTDMTTEQAVRLFGDTVKNQFSSANDPVVVTIGASRALRVDVPEARMDGGRSARARAYLVIAETATAMIVCLWVPEQEDIVAAACDEVAARIDQESD